MSPKVRFASALLVVAALACGSLGALPLGPRVAPPESVQSGIVTAVVEWVVALLTPGTPERPTRSAHKPAQTKAGSNMDPNGGCCPTCCS